MLRRAKVNINPEQDPPPDDGGVKRGLSPPSTSDSMSQLSPLAIRGQFGGKEAKPFLPEKDTTIDSEEQEDDDSSPNPADGKNNNVGNGDEDEDEEMKDAEKDSDIGDTEDELEVNEAGRQMSSDEEDSINDTGSDDDDDSDDDMEDRPWDFVSGKIAASTLGRNVRRPVAVGGSRENSPVGKEQDRLDANDESSDSSSSSSEDEEESDDNIDDANSSDSGSDDDDESDVEDIEGIRAQDGNDVESVSSEESDTDVDVDVNEVVEEDSSDGDGEEGDDGDEDEKEGIPMDDEDDDDDDEIKDDDASERSEKARSRIELMKEDDISIEELEDIINESSPRDDNTSDADSDMELSDAEALVSAIKGISEIASDEEVSGFISDSFEFDYWSQDVLSAAVKLLSTAKDTNDDLKCSRYPVRLPSSTHATFWVDKMLAAVSPHSPALQILAESPERKSYASKKIHDMFYSELSTLDISHITFPTDASDSASSPFLRGHLFVGSFAAAESRLALAALHVKHVIQLSSHPLDELWVGDGVNYSTNILPGCESKGAEAMSAVIAESALQVASTLQDSRESMSGEESSVLVACSTGDEHSSAVCALFLMQAFGCDRDTAIEYMVKHRDSAQIDPSWLSAAKKPSAPEDKKVSPPCPKRMLSSQMLSALLKDKGDSPKRQRVKFSESSGQIDEKNEYKSTPDVILPALPLFNLGEPAHPSFQMRGAEREVSSSDEDLETDRQLGEELQDKGSDNEESEPVPLLTPPASPQTIHCDKGDTTVCEWPSNLAVDSAYSSAITDTRPLSPSSLQKQEEEEEKRILQSPKYTQKTLPDPSTGLTPKVRGISVGFQASTSSQ